MESRFNVFDCVSANIHFLDTFWLKSVFIKNHVLIKSKIPSSPFVLVITARNSSCRKVMFLHLSVSHSVHGGGVGTDTPLGRPPWQTPLGRHTLLGRPLLRDGHCSRRYASYWNAFLLVTV